MCHPNSCFPWRENHHKTDQQYSRHGVLWIKPTAGEKVNQNTNGSRPIYHHRKISRIKCNGQIAGHCNTESVNMDKDLNTVLLEV